MKTALTIIKKITLSAQYLTQEIRNMSHVKNKIKIPAKKTALAFVEIILPEGEVIDEVNAEALFASMAKIISRFPPLSLVLFLMLWCLEIRCIFSTGRLYRSLSFTRRVALHELWITKTISRLFVRGLAMPFKLAYTLDESTVKKVGVHNGIDVAPAEDARWTRNILKADDRDENEEIEADVVIVGTGAGGACAAI